MRACVVWRDRAERVAGWRGARALRAHCCAMMHTLGAATPPEAFLYRGNAYYALGRPYLALADYHIAAEVLRFAPTHEHACWRALAHFPATQTLTYGASDATRHLYVTPHMHDACVVRPLAAYTPHDLDTDGSNNNSSNSNNQVAHDDDDDDDSAARDVAERGVVARQRLRTGTTVLGASATPWLRYATQEGCCTHCARVLTSRVFACPHASCHEEYCSRECRAQAWRGYHGAVCRNSAYQAIELDVYATLTRLRAASPHNSNNNDNNDNNNNVDEDMCAIAEVENQLLLLRVMAAAVQSRCAPSALGELRLLRGRLVVRPADVLATSLLQLYERVVRALRVRTTVSYEELLGVLARVTANRLPYVGALHNDRDDDDNDEDEQCDGGAASSSSPALPYRRRYARYGSYVELRLPHAMLNHSCDANASYVRDRDDDNTKDGDRDGKRRRRRTSGHVVDDDNEDDRDARVVMTRRDVAAGDEVTVCYAPELCTIADVRARRAALRRRFGFDCRCARCLRELSSSTSS